LSSDAQQPAHHGVFGNDRFGVLAERAFEARQTDVLRRERALAEQHLVLLSQNTKLTEQIARLTTEHQAVCVDAVPTAGGL
jgi:hypothetical protein